MAQLPQILQPALLTRWKAILDPLLAQPIVSAGYLEGIVLKTGVNVINHKLGRLPQGWLVSDINAAITLYRSAPFNDLTLTLTASGAATVNLVVF